jgi:hypothetical protein
MVIPTNAPKVAPPIPLTLNPKYAKVATTKRDDRVNMRSDVCFKKKFLSDCNSISPPAA